MGRVYAYEEAFFSPEREDFEQAVVWFQGGMAELADRGLVTGAFVHGSAAIGLANTRSDIDVLVALTNDKRHTYEQVRLLLHTIVNDSQTSLMFEPFVLTRQDLATANHDKDRYFGAHLKAPDRLVVGEDPAEYMKFADETPAQILQRYLAHKIESANNAYLATGRDSAEGQGLQRILELPKAVGRKTLQAVSDHQGLPTDYAMTNPASYLPTATELFEQHNLSDDFNWLRDLDEQYTQLLWRVKKGVTDKLQYYAELSAIRSEIPRAIHWLNRVGQTFLPQLEAA